MSSFGDLVNSIGSGKAAPNAPKPFQRQPAPSSAAHTKPAPRAIQQATNTSSAPAVPKRKLEENDQKSSDRPLKVTLPPGAQNKISSRPSTPTINGTKLAVPKVANNPPTPSSAGPIKAPPKGSFADIMARAKQAQEQKSTSKVGMIKHQATSKEKISKVAERRRAEQERLKNDKRKQERPPQTREGTGKRRSASPVKKAEQLRAPKTARPPLHAPAGYKGTMGTMTKRPRDSADRRASKRSRYDEYLGTDEEEDSGMDDDEDDGQGYGSDASSDMEAGLDELESEEQLALRVAREDDAKELALENSLKREKEERRRRLAAMAKRGR